MKKNGCLTWIIGFFVVCLLIGLYSLAWIPAIGFIIYYLIKKDYSGTRKRNFIISIIIFITSLLLFIWGTNSSSLTDIQADWGKTTFDVSETVEVKITPTPSDAKIEKLTLSDNDIAKLKYKDGKAIVSFKKVGTTTVTFTANDSIDSNAATITVKDKKAEEAAKKAKEEQERLAEEKAKKEAEEKPLKKRLLRKKLLKKLPLLRQKLKPRLPLKLRHKPKLNNKLRPLLKRKHSNSRHEHSNKQAERYIGFLTDRYIIQLRIVQAWDVPLLYIAER